MLKAYKSLKGYKYFTTEWVSNANLQELPGSVPVKVILTIPKSNVHRHFQ